MPVSLLHNIGPNFAQILPLRPHSLWLFFLLNSDEICFMLGDSTVQLIFTTLGTINKKLLSCLTDFVHKVNPNPPPNPFLMDNINTDEIPTKIK